MKNKAEYTSLRHEIPPFYRDDSRVLILGSFPSVLSREEGFFYGNPKNRFWRVLSSLFGEEEPKSIEEKKDLLERHCIAVWDVISSCMIRGSSDSSIKDVIPNNIKSVIDSTRISLIILNGRTAERLYKKYIEESVTVRSICLPSTSPANAAFSLERLVSLWGEVLLGKEKE